MTPGTECIKLTSYFSERRRADGRFLADAQLAVFGRHQLATSVLLRGIGGFGLTHHLRTDQLLTLSEDLPVVSVAVDERTKIEAALAELTALDYRGLVTMERAQLLRGELGPVRLPRRMHEATKLTIYVGRQERVYRAPAFAAVCELLHRRGLDGATVFLGVDGTNHGQHTRARFFGRNADVPMMIIGVGTGEAVARVLSELGGLLHRPMVTVERVRVCKRAGQLVSRPHPLPGQDDNGAPLWQKLMVYTTERDQHRGEPVHRALVRRLRASRARGATVLRGIWGFTEGQPPHGDRAWRLGRTVGVCTILVDTPDRIADSFDIVDELTTQHGLVTSEMVPAIADNAPATPPPLAHHDY